MNVLDSKINWYKFKTSPYKHQLDALERSWDKEYFAYFMEMGTGKSKVLIDNAAMLYNQGKINGLLLISPTTFPTLLTLISARLLIPLAITS